MIIDDKAIANGQAPPSYMSSTAGLPPFSSRHPGRTLSTLPPNILLHIIYCTFPQTSLLDEGRPERQRKTLYWISTSLRLVNHTMYMACMHILRSTYLPAYDALIRKPYSSDPFPLQAPAEDTSVLTRAPTLQRETAILDKFIALKVREDVWADDSELHLERDESFKDLFDLMQPKSRLEDLVRVYGIRDGVITLSPHPSWSSPSSSARSTPKPTPPPTSTSFFASLSFRTKSKSRDQVAQPPTPRRIVPIPFAQISVTILPRMIGLTLNSSGRRTIVETPWTREQKLESAAKRLVKELKVWLEENS